MNSMGVMALFYLWILWTAAPGALSAAERPNVVVILADDLGWGDLSCYGNPKFKTPNIDRMAREGARLTSFYSTCPFCAPSRAALLTGRYQFRSGMTRSPTPDAGINDVGVPRSEITLAEAFRQAGYRTAMVGKWHLGHQPEFYPVRHGFEEYLGILYTNDERPVQLVEGEKVVEYPVVQATLTQRYTQRAIQFIQRNRARPFFLYFAHAMPHKPLAASEPFYKKSGAGLYGDVMAELDWSVGQVLDKLKELGLRDKTLVFFSSDNGPWYGGSTGGLRGMKGNSWEGGYRVPLIAWWPGKIPAGHSTDQPAALFDIFVTSLKAAGIRPPSDRVIDGKDIMPLLTGVGPSPHEALFCMVGPRLCAVRSGKWKLQVAPATQVDVLKPGEPWVDPRAPDGVTILAPYEQAHPSQYPGLLTGDETRAMSLFDLEKDAGEQRNVADQHPEVVKDLKTRFDAMQSEIARTKRP